MNNTERPAALSVDEAKQIINAWCAHGFFRVKGLADKMFLEELIPHSSYTVRLRSQYDERTVSPATEAYHQGPVDDRGTPPDRWSMEVRYPEDFEKRTEKVRVPHTERVQSCDSCDGRGKVNCSHCQGWGKVMCPLCQGKGYRERTEMRANPGGGSTTQTVRDNCTCFGGKVNCTFCSGFGKVKCTSCEGSGRVKHFELLTVEFKPKTLTAVHGAAGVPEELVRQAHGRTLINERAKRIETCGSVTPVVDKEIQNQLNESHNISPRESRLLFQELVVEQVPIQEVVYRYRGSAAKRLWIYGNEQHIHAPKVPRPWLKILGVFGGIAAAVAGIVYALVYFLVLRT
jgi:hypothetical protein